MKSRFVSQAEADLSVAAKWYEKQRPGLGRELIFEVHATIRVIEDDPLRFARTNPRARTHFFRRASVGRFPYDVIFEVESDIIWIYAVVHHSRRPGYYRRRKS